MKKQKISIIVLFLMMMGIIVLFVTGTKESYVTLEDENITLDWYINFSWFTTTWGESEVSQAITEKTGVNINFIVPNGNPSEKLNSIMATEKLPDIITLGWWEENVDRLIKEDKVYALNELADQYDMYFYQVIDKDSFEWYRNDDGNVYCYPNSSYSPKDYENGTNIYSNQNFMVRKDIYEALGKPDMTTPEGFSDAVKRAALLYPEVDGETLIPIGADEFTVEGCNSFGQYLQNFLAIPYEKNGVYYDRYTDDEYVKWMKTYRQLAEEGYLSDEIFIDKRAQIEENFARGRYFCILYQSSDMQEQENQIYEENPDRIYIPVDGPKNTNQDDPRLPGSGLNGWTVTLITKDCKSPDRAIQLLTYLISEEGQKMVYLGVPGSMYDMKDGKPVVKSEILQLRNADRNAYDKKYGADNTYWMLQNNKVQDQWRDEEPEIGRMKEWTKPYTVYTGQYEIRFPKNSTEAAINNEIQQEWGRVLPRLLLAESEEKFDTILQEFVERRNELGYNKVLTVSTQIMNENKEKMGLR